MASLASVSGSDATDVRLAQLEKVGAGGAASKAESASVEAAPVDKVPASVPKPEAAADASVPGTIFGRTESGHVFPVPQTHDMLHTLLDPRLSKTLVDVLTVLALLSNFVLYWELPQSARTPVFFVLFMFWRGMYNGGIGWLLSQQSDQRLLVQWARDSGILETEGAPKAATTPTGASTRGWIAPQWLRAIAHKDLRARLKPRSDAEIWALPTEFKTWILFRHFVDLVLMSDFVTYCLLGVSVLHVTNHSWLVAIGRLAAGIVLILFNLWVKIDAHRVVKDYAWYWGDFFFLEDVNLTFDGVFELAPHPMYSIGYAAYYGVSLITASATLFTASLLAHAAQFAFLIVVENPHIEKTYGSPESKKAKHLGASADFAKASPQAMLLFKNFNFTRTSDIALVFLTVTTAVGVVMPRSPVVTGLLIVAALFWRLAHTLGLGVLLYRQSTRKQWTRLHLKYGGTPLEAYQEWQAIYNTTLVLSYVSLGVLWLRELSTPRSVAYLLFRVILGLMLIALHTWTSYSIYEELGEYGWFFGDFFYTREGHALTFSGIYRYLNHPERFIGITGVWGMALIGYSSIITFFAIVYTITNVAFIQFVEKPHMAKLYGEQSIKRASGVSKNIKKQTSAIFIGAVGFDLDAAEQYAVSLAQRYVGVWFDRLELLRPHAEGVVVDTRSTLRQYPAKMTQILSGDVSAVDRTQYTVKTDRGRYAIGEPVAVEWTAPAARSARDWIGLYRLGENTSRDITSKSSAGRWSAVDATGFDIHTAGIVDTAPTHGHARFAGALLFWAPGVYEFRYHHNGKHNVLAISAPIEIVAERRDLSRRSVQQVAAELRALYATCATAPGAPSELAAAVPAAAAPLDLQDNEVLARFTESIEYLYDVDVAPFVLQADGSAEKIAERLLYIHRSLAEQPGSRQVTPAVAAPVATATTTSETSTSTAAPSTDAAAPSAL